MQQCLVAKKDLDHNLCSVKNVYFCQQHALIEVKELCLHKWWPQNPIRYSSSQASVSIQLAGGLSIYKKKPKQYPTQSTARQNTFDSSSPIVSTLKVLELFQRCSIARALVLVLAIATSAKTSAIDSRQFRSAALLLHTTLAGGLKAISIVCPKPQYLFVVDQEGGPFENTLSLIHHNIFHNLNFLFCQLYFQQKVYFEIILPVL